MAVEVVGTLKEHSGLYWSIAFAQHEPIEAWRFWQVPRFESFLLVIEKLQRTIKVARIVAAQQEEILCDQIL